MTTTTTVVGICRIQRKKEGSDESDVGKVIKRDNVQLHKLVPSKKKKEARINRANESGDYTKRCERDEDEARIMLRDQDETRTVQWTTKVAGGGSECDIVADRPF